MTTPRELHQAHERGFHSARAGAEARAETGAETRTGGKGLMWMLETEHP